ncbi:MAG: hypothetical protein LBC74_04695, partial [Planctomycetaceae bacterium]|nr:hypothetical protein [Planctomycetaceae bacterium]
MAIYFNTNLPETSGLLYFDRTTNKINEILQRLETGYRINSGKDDPTGLIKREGLRLEMKGLQSAINNSIAGQNMISVAEKAMGGIASLLTGDPTDSQDTGIIGLLNSKDAGAIANGINQLANTIDAISRTTIYNGKQIINGAYDYNTTVTGALTNVKVTSANVTEGKPTEFSFKVDQVAEKAGVEIVDKISIAQNNYNIITLTDNNGKTVNVELTNSGSTGKDYSAVEIADEIKSALASNSGIDLEIDESTLFLTTKTKGEDQKLTISTVDQNGNNVDLSGVFKAITSSTNGYVVDSTNKIITATGQDWKLSGIEGTVVMDDNKINVYSNSINFSGELDDNVADNDE